MAAVFLAAGSAHAQDDAALRRRMELLTRSLATEADEAPESFFPRRGDWTWYPSWAGHQGVHRFPARDTKRALEDFCPLWDSFRFQPEGQPVGGLIGWSLEHPRGWRRVRGTRFVPPGEPASSPVFVEWRREDGRWVISSFGDASGYAAPVGEPPPNSVATDTAGATAYAAGEPWFDRFEPIYFEGRRYLEPWPMGTITRDLLTRVGSLGRVGIYAEAGDRDRDHLFVPSGPGPAFVAYRTYQHRRCAP